MHFSRLLPLLLCFVSSLAFAQKPKPADFGIKSKKALNYYFEGRQQEQWRARDEAINAYKAALELEPDFAHAHFRLGVNAYVRKRDEDALEHLERAFEINPDPFPNIGFYLGEAYFRNEQYAEAVPKLERFLQQERMRRQDQKQAQETLKHARFAAQAIQQPVSFEPLNMGEAINTDRDEYLPHLTADDQFLLFTSRRPESVGGFNRALKDYGEDFYFSEFANGEWSPAQNLGLPINTAGNEGSAAITQDGRTIYFTACNREDGQGSCDLYVSYREGDSWSEAQNLGPRVNSEGWESQPCLSPDGKRLYFASSRSGGMGGRDIWYVERINDQYWSLPVNLGSPINTAGNEYSPFIHADGKSLYFSSDYHPGFGSQDLFVSYAQPNDKWADPINLGYPLNTKADESNIFVSANGRKGFINSYREGGLGESDLYEFVLDERVRPQIATFLRGITIDSLTRAP
ncbi:MAG: tetratricopeptide repeat protein, partial [Bacteroidota bacterium]